MSRLSLRVRRAWLVPALVAFLAVLLLVIAGAQAGPRRTFTSDAPNVSQLAVMHPQARVCEGGVTSDGPSDAVGVWGGSVGPVAGLKVEVQDARTGRTLARGGLDVGPPLGEHVADLHGQIPGGRPVRVCLVEVFGAYGLWGSGIVHPGFPLTGMLTDPRAPVPGAFDFSLVLLNAHRSLLGSLSTAFSRAALFRPSWVGSWTFWLLAAGVLATFALAVVAVTAAASDEEDPPLRRASRR